jgi:hypothetical protein
VAGGGGRHTRRRLAVGGDGRAETRRGAPSRPKAAPRRAAARAAIRPQALRRGRPRGCRWPRPSARVRDGEDGGGGAAEGRSRGGATRSGGRGRSGGRDEERRPGRGAEAGGGAEAGSGRRAEAATRMEERRRERVRMETEASATEASGWRRRLRDRACEE